MPEPLFMTVAQARPAVPVRLLAHRAACGDHHAEAGWMCEMGKDNAERVVDAIADWLTGAQAHAIVLGALNGGAHGVTAALAQHLRSTDA